MKRNRLLVVFLVMFAGCLFSGLQAQENLQRWVKSCEKESSVDMTVISKKDPKTKKEESKSVSINFRNNPSLLKKLIEAYNKDKDNAYQISEKVIKGQTRPDYCRFLDKNVLTRYYFTFKKDGDISIYMKITYDGDD